MNILDYNIHTFKKYGQNHLTEFSPGKVSRGPIERDLALNVIEKLNKNKGAGEQAIEFKAEHLALSLEGGACSVLSFRIAEKVFDLFSQCNEYGDFKTNVTKITNDLNDVLTKGNSSSSKERGQIRSLQAALNAFSLPLGDAGKDNSGKKIKAIASYFNLTVESSTSEIKIQPDSSCVEALNNTTKSLDRGVYLVRTLRPADNSEEAKRKQEKYGHSTLYIKYAQGQELYFDPNLGLFDLGSHEGADDIVFQAQCAAQVKFQLELCKFHKLANSQGDQA